jgi:hypothetical protein
MSEGKAKILPTELARREREEAREERLTRLEEAIYAAVREHMRRDPLVSIDDVVSALGALADLLENISACGDELLKEAGRSPEEGDRE